jgi:hypothetical protein
VVAAGELATSVANQATAGTLCLVGRRRTPALPEFATPKLLDSRIRTIVCAPTSADASDVMAMLAKASTIDIPPLSERRSELGRLLDECADDAVKALGAPGTGFREHEHGWLDALEYETLAEIDEVALRVVALRSWGVSGGATRLGVTHGALSTWASRRKIPT